MKLFLRLTLPATVLAFALTAPFSATAATVALGGTQADGSGGIVLDDASAMVSVADVGYFAPATTPAAEWVWKDIGTNFGRPTDPIRFVFDLTGYDIATVAMDGLWAVDDLGTARLNGNVISSIVTIGSFSSMTPFSVNAASGFFNAGSNLLTFDVFNVSGPAGFRAAVTVTADASSGGGGSGPVDPVNPIPLPAGLPLLLGGLGLLALLRRRHA